MFLNLNTENWLERTQSLLSWFFCWKRETFEALFVLAANYPDGTQTVFTGIQALSTVIIAAIGGIWVLYNFQRTRQQQPVINTTHQIFHKRVEPYCNRGSKSILRRLWKRNTDGLDSLNACLLRVTITITNEGFTVIEGIKGKVSIFELEPWNSDLLENVQSWRDAKNKEQNEVHLLSHAGYGGMDYKWGTIEEAEFERAPADANFEPREVDEFSFDFLIDSGFETILIYSWIANPKKTDEEIGWSKTTVYELGRS